MVNHKRVVVAAANKLTVSVGGEDQEVVLVDNCHFGRNMQRTLDVFKKAGLIYKSNKEGCRTRGQGFIDQNGVYMDRGEALEVAKASGQPINKEFILPSEHSGYEGGNLDSSCIRHFEEDTPFVDYLGDGDE